MEEQEQESPSVATQTELTTVCHQGTSVNELLIATGLALLTTERIKVKCHRILYGRAIPAPSDNEFQSGWLTQTPRRKGIAKMTQVPEPYKNRHSKRVSKIAQRRTIKKQKRKTKLFGTLYDGLSKAAKRKFQRHCRVIEPTRNK